MMCHRNLYLQRLLIIFDMINYVIGNIFDSDADALVNTVNTVGVMGKGIALQFRKLYPNNYRIYRSAYEGGQLEIGKLLVTEDRNLISGRKIIINFPTKEHWRNPSKYEYIEKGLVALVRLIEDRSIRSIAIPPLGAGNGGLQWHKVRKLLNEYLQSIDDCHIVVYEPNSAVAEAIRRERVKLTPARAMLLSMLFELVRSGEFVSEFASEKLCYFLQRNGGEDYLKLQFKGYFYGPYSGKVRHVLNYLNGSYLMGYADMDRRPFEALNLLVDSEETIESYIKKDNQLNEIVTRTKALLQGFYSPFSLELLSTVDYIARECEEPTVEFVKTELENWSQRKKSNFSDDYYIDISLQQLRAGGLIA